MRILKLAWLATILTISPISAQDVTQPHPGSKDIQVTGTLPVMHIITADNVPITQKETYVQATCWIDALGIEGFESVGSANEPLALGIRGRGNSSWTYDKKPYKLKLEKKTSLLGMPKHKHWALLNHVPSQEGLLEMIAFEVGRCVGLPWTPRVQPVEVMLNDRNIGLYYLAETVKIDKNRINIYEQPDNNTDVATIDGGWLLEIDNYDDPYQVKIMQDAQGDAFEARFTHKTPEELSQMQRDWLVSELTTITEAIYSPDKSNLSWQDKIDVEALAKYYIAQEFMSNLDAFVGSTYLYKDLEGKWVFGPLWDCSWVINESPRTGSFIEQRRAVCEKDPTCQSIKFTWIEEMWKYPEFRNIVKKEWDKIYPTKFAGLADYISEMHDKLKTAYDQDYTKIWTQYPHFDLTYMRNSYIAAVDDYGKWLDTYLSNAAISDVTADAVDCNVTLSITNLGNGIIEVTSPQTQITRVDMISLNGTVMQTDAIGENQYRTDAESGLYVIRAFTSSGKTAVSKLVFK